MNRLTIYTSDIVSITGKSQRSAQRMMQTAKDALAKQKHQNITIKEFCGYFGYPIAEIEDHLKLRHSRQ